MATSAKAIANKFGQAVEKFEAASTDAVEDILIKFSNESIRIMKGDIAKKSRTGHASHLGQSFNVLPVSHTRGKISIATESEAPYWDYFNKGVRGVKRNKAPKSKYKFKNLGTPPKMIESFKDYIARTGSRVSGKKLIRKNKKKQADLILAAAKQLAVATKIGGIEPSNFVDAAINKKRTAQLRKDITKAIGKSIRIAFT